nr:plasmid recombination protein [uncultured Gemmiger sp.]
MKRTISAMVGKGSLNHNSREFYASNVDPSRSHLNIEFCREDIQTVYHELFDEAQERFNAKQTRNDRRIEDYYEKICSSKQEKPFHEIVLQIGNKDDAGVNTELAETAKQCLTEYAQGFQARNPTLRVFWSHLHMDEATPHIHIDFVPYITGSKRGMDTRVSLKQALAQLGFKGGTRSATEWNQWAQNEKQALAEIMLEHGIEWEQLGTHKEHLSVLDYKKQERAKEVRALDSTIAEKQTQIDEIEQTLQSVQKQVIDIDKIENISVKKALLSDKVTLPRNDFENLLNAAKQYVVYRRQDDRLQGLLDAANGKIKQLESVVGELKRKVSGLVDELSNIEFWHKRELDEVKSESREVRRENLMLKREQKGLMNLLRRHCIDPAKERIHEQEHGER